MVETVLILGGTAEAAKLARAAHEKFAGRVRIIVSLAGRTRAPAALPVETRAGGFGGPAGLAEYLLANGISLVVDATHPFAARISANARMACAAANVPRLQLVRPEWTMPKLARVTWAASLEEAAALLPDLGKTAFLAVGGRGLAAFAPIKGVRLVARAVEMPDDKPAGIECTVVAPDARHLYSGMVPGYLAGQYSLQAIGIDVEAMCRFAGVRCPSRRLSTISQKRGTATSWS